MVTPRLTSRIVTGTLTVGISAALLLAVTSCSSPVLPGIAGADEPKDADAKKVDEVDPEYAVPDGTPEEILEFIDKLRSRRAKFANRQEALNHAINVQRAFISAGGKILAQEVDDKTATKAAQMKLGALRLLAMNAIGDSSKEAMEAVTALKNDKREAVVKVADQFWMSIRVINAPSMPPAEREAFLGDVLKAAVDAEFSRETLAVADQLGDVLADSGSSEEAGLYYDRLAKAVVNSSHKDADELAQRFQGLSRKARLPGNSIDLKGKLLNGHELDWKSYRGKVVLVDFWATWCGPCIAELPNVKENYKKYHEKGFDVVGISLDRSREALDKFIEKEEIPWAQLYDEEIQKGTGWNHPLAQHYGIHSIPAAILVDQEGKVVSMQARGEDLTKMLEKLLGKAE